MNRYWIVFRVPLSPEYLWLSLGCGVTARDREDALGLVQERILAGGAPPPIEKITEHIDVSTLDMDHVLPNIGNVLVRGIWFPKGF